MTIIILIITFFLPLIQSQAEFLQRYDGMISVSMGKTYLEKGILTLQYDLKPPSDLVTLLCNLNDRILKTRLMILEYKNNKTDATPDKGMLQMLQNVNKKLVSVFKSNYLINNIPDCNATLSEDIRKGRFERGLINAGGDLLKFLFGTAVEDDVQDFQDKTRTLTRQVQLIIDENSRHLIEINRNFDDLKAAHRAQAEEFYHLKFDSFLLRANAVIEETKTTLVLIDTVISSAIQQVVHPTLIPFNDFKKVVQEGITSLRLSPLLPLEFKYYYQYLALSTVKYEGKSFSLRINIPYSDTVVYDTYLAHPFPNIRHKAYYLEIDNTPIIVAKSAHHHFYLSLLEYEQCRHANDFTLCQKRNKKTLTESCVLNLLRNATNMCSYKKRPMDMVSKDPVVVTFEGNSLVNFGNNNTRASIDCPTASKTVITADIIYVPSVCSLISDKLTLFPKNSQTYHKILKIPITNNFLNLPSIEHDLKLENSSISLINLVDNEEKFIDLKFKYDSHLVIHYVVYALLAIAAIGIVSFHFYKKRLRRIKHDRICQIMRQSRRETREGQDLFRASVLNTPATGRRSRANTPPVYARTVRLQDTMESLPAVPETATQETGTL